MQWWDWDRSWVAMDLATRTLIRDRPYTVCLEVGGGCYVDFWTRKVAIDPTFVNRFGGKELLPILWLDGEGRDLQVTNLASLQWLVSLMAAYHEGGHVLFTAPYPTRGELHADLTNSLEDQRMETCTAAHYPPALHAFRAYARLQALWVPLPALERMHRIDVMLNACLFYRWARQFPGSFEARYRFHNAEDQAFWREQVRPLVEEAWVAPSARRVSDIALDILRRLGVPERSARAGHTLYWTTDTMRRPGKRHTGDQPLERPGTDAPSVGAPNTDPSYHPVEPQPPGMDVEAAADLWARPYRQLALEVRGHRNRLRKVLKVPTPNTAPRPAKMGGRFWMPGYVRTQGRYAYRRQRGKGRSRKGLACVLLIDRTGSMGGCPYIDPETGELDEAVFFDPQERMPHARQAAMLFEEVCPSSGIPLCIGFAGNDCVLPHTLTAEGEWQHRDDREHPVSWIRLFETPLDAEGPKALIAGMYGSGEEECLSLSLREAQKKLAQRSEGTKLILYIHDGLPTDERVETAQATIAALRKQQTIVVGIYVGPPEYYERLQTIFGQEFTILVESLPVLIDRVGRMLVTYARR